MTKLLNTEHINAMIKAMRKTELFKIERDRTTAVATTGKGLEIFRAIKHSKQDRWIVRHHDQLFS